MTRNIGKQDLKNGQEDGVDKIRPCNIYIAFKVVCQKLCGHLDSQLVLHQFL